MKRASPCLAVRGALTLALALALLAGGCRRDRPPAVAVRTGALTLEASLRTDPPRQQDNALDLVVKDRDDRPVEDAVVEIVASMPSMAWVPGMRSRAEVTPEGSGRYRAEFDLLMGGTWALDVAVTSPQGAGNASYSLTIGSRGLQPVGATAGAVSAARPEAAADFWVTPPINLPEPARGALERALAAYDVARSSLARGRLEGALPAARQMAEALRAARGAVGESGREIGTCLEHGVGASEQLASASDLAGARSAFGELSRFLIAVVSLDPGLRSGRHLFECPMTETFNLWLQAESEIANPYLGPEMLTCGSERPWGKPEVTPGPLTGQAISHYTCSMHTTVRSDLPGTCPICSMDLVPVTVEEVQTGVIVVDPRRRQTIGVRTGPVERRRVLIEVRAVGKVTFDETRLVDVSVKYPGWIGRLEVNATGQQVRKGQTLFSLYSPELYAAQEEFLSALRSRQAAQETAAPERADYLVEASRERLSLWDLEEQEIDEIARRGRPSKYLPIPSPASGYVIEKEVVEGTAVMPGARLYRIAALDRIWVEAEVYESELGLVSVGQEAKITSPSLPGVELTGRVTFVYPYLEDASRTGRVRIELPNRRLELKPEMYADVVLTADRGERLVVPESAVVYAGPRRLVFLDLGEGRLQPQVIEVGARSGDVLEVLSGLTEGDVVVTSGTFLVAAESRLKSALEQWQ